MVSCKNGKADDIQSEVITYSDDVKVPESREDKMIVNFTYEHITAMPNDEALQIVQDSIMSYTFDLPYAQMEPRDAMEAFSDTLLKEYIILNQDYSADAVNDEDMASTFSAEYVITTGIKNIGETILSYEINRYVYYGGAHGSTVTRYLNFNIESGELVHERDLFVDDYETKLTAMLVDQLLNQLHLTSIQELEDNLYDISEIHPNDNFYIDATGYTWFFNTYDIAPYFVGTTAITLTEEQLADILKK